MSGNAELIVLHTTKYGENSLVLHTLSKEYGRRSFFVRGVGRKAAMSLFLPLNIIEADISENGRSRLAGIRHPLSLHPLMGIRGSVSKNAMTMFISEVLYRVIKDGAMEPGLYEMCEKNILLLDAIQEDFSNFHIWFLLEFIIVLGFSVAPEDLSPFTGERKTVVCEFIKSSFSEAMLIPLSGETRNEIAEDLLRYISHNIESSVNVNSLKVLRDLFTTL